MPWLGLSPFVVRAVGIGLAVLAVVGCLAAIFFHIESLGEAKADAKTAQGVAKLAQDNAATSAQMAAKQQGIAHDAQLQAGAASAAAARAATERDAFRVRLNAYLSASRGAQPAAAASGSTPAADPLGVLADVLGRADDRAKVLAAYADQSRIAGLACERSYDALTAATAAKP